MIFQNSMQIVFWYIDFFSTFLNFIIINFDIHKIKLQTVDIIDEVEVFAGLRDFLEVSFLFISFCGLLKVCRDFSTRHEYLIVTWDSFFFLPYFFCSCLILYLFPFSSWIQFCPALLGCLILTFCDPVTVFEFEGVRNLWSCRFKYLEICK